MIYHSFLGELFIEEGRISAFRGQKQSPKRLEVKKLACMLDNYFTGKNFEPMEALEGVAVGHNQLKVLKGLAQIPFGQTICYSDFSFRVGLKSVRSAATLIGKNPLPIIFPCHRVIRKDGAIGKFSLLEGSKTKKALLDFEKRGILGAQPEYLKDSGETPRGRFRTP